MALSTLGKSLSGATFVVLLPVALTAWAIAARGVVPAPSVVSVPFGVAAVTVGLSLMILGMSHLWIYGGGLPMNAAPPPRFVDRGIYRFLPHPIYVGFCVACAGVSIAVGSASGLWLITPLVVLGCTALVLGYERHDLQLRFGSIPDESVAGTGSEIRAFALRGLAATAIGLTFSFSLEVIWTCLAAEVIAVRWCFWGRIWSAVVVIGCVMFQSGVSVLGGVVTVALVSSGPAVWHSIRARSERIANSWMEWRFGPVRVINHGLYAGLGAFLSLSIAGVLSGPDHETALMLAAGAAVIGAALWAQYIEGSPQLLRPYGFYGGLLGGTLGALIAPFFGTSVWLLLAAFSAGGPWAQALGRLRCLVQGCCHGRPAPDSVGIRYTHPRSRVCRFTEWTGSPLHPTPVYSILWNGVVAIVVLRLWTLHAALNLIAGLYFVLTGMGRFVEEAWRGEPQTPIHAGLRLYQWAAIASVALGALMTAMGSGGPAPTPEFSWNVILPAAAFGIVVCFAMGVDFPNSNRRFSRLV
jgi:protein-S-isoprenylcysteine O-methyltransferase Ste14